MGDKITIKVVAANLAKRQLDYEWVIAGVAKDNSPEDVAGVAKKRVVAKEAVRGKEKEKKQKKKKK